MPEAKDRLAVALDFSDAAELRDVARRLAADVGVVKIGLEAFVSHGPALVREVVAMGCRVFLDLKLHDIPNTVGGAAEAAAKTGAFLLNVHASGGVEMMREAGRRAREAARAASLPAPKVIAVTILTSLDASALSAVGLAGSPREAAVRLALLAKEAGLDGVVCSPEEIAAIRAACGEGFLLVVPGIRPAGASAEDQRRVSTPEAAIRAGADLLVVGRPITRAEDPVGAARRIALEIARAREAETSAVVPE